jgi:single-strand DNA-binding protein
MASINKVILIGNIGRDLELKQTTTGTAVCTLTLATTRRVKDKEPETEWHNCTAYGRTAEIASQYLAKGSSVYIEGRLHTRKWTDKSGNNRYTTEIIIENLQMLGSKNSANSASQPQQQSQQSGGYVSESDCPF